jgi:hypothetical protein
LPWLIKGKAVSAVTLAILIAVSLSFQSCNLGKKPPPFLASPVKIMGGSISFRCGNQNGWDPTNQNGGIHTHDDNPLSPILFENDCKLNSNTGLPNPIIVDSTTSWKITISAANDNNTAATENGVMICSNQTCDLSSSATQGNTVTIIPVNHAQIFGPDAGSNGQYHYVGVQDDNRTPCDETAGQSCEKMEQIDVQVGTNKPSTYSVDHNCHIDISPLE